MKKNLNLRLMILFRGMFCKKSFRQNPLLIPIYFVLTMIAIIAIIMIIAKAKKVTILAIIAPTGARIVFREKLKTPFPIKPKVHTRNCSYPKNIQRS